MIRTIINKNIFRPLKNKFAFSTLSDPFYILGVEKNAEFGDIKKQFYKLANEYHPDKNKSPEAMKKFLIIKEAFQAIKMQKGLIVPQGFVYDDQGTSMRPNPSQFMSEDEEKVHKNADYKMYAEKAESGGEEYMKFKGSFQTIHDINDIKIKVQEGKMKESTSRFQDFDLKAKIKFLSEHGQAPIVIGFIGVFFFLTFFGNSVDKMKSQQMTKTQMAIKKSQKYREDLSTEDERVKLKKEKLSQLLRENPELMKQETLSLKSKKRQKIITSSKQSV